MAPEPLPKRQKLQSDLDLSSARQTALPLSEGSSSTDLQQPPRSSWYNSWPRKAQPVTQIAHESTASEYAVMADARSNSTTKDRSLRSPSLAMTLGKKQAGRAMPLDTTTTKINAGASSPSRKNSESMGSTNDTNTMHDDKPITDPQSIQNSAPQSIKTPPKEKSEEKQPIIASTPQRSSWLGWIGRADNQASFTSEQEISTTSENEDSSRQASVNAEAQTVPDRPNTVDQLMAEAISGTSSRRSWLPWSTEGINPSTAADWDNAAKKSTNEHAKNIQSTDSVIPPAASINTEGSKHEDEVISSSGKLLQQYPQEDGPKAAAWAFWSRDRKANASSISVETSRSGEVAVSNTPSQRNPQRTSVILPKSDKPNPPKEHSKPDLGKSEPEVNKQPSTNIATTPVKLETAEALALALRVDDKKPAVPNKSTKGYQNILLPELQSTLKLPEHPSIMQQLARLLTVSKEPEAKHLSLVREPPRIRHALAVGVHGYFPAPLIRTVLGQPTGTSIKFADMAAKSIQRWTKARGYECHVKRAALEGEGKIAERVELLWKLLLNWIEEIRKSDFVLVACHSQGVPVAIMLVAKLIEFGCLNGARVGICAMAGVNMGPFTDYKSRWISGSAGELFEFSDPTSKVSTDYLAALQLSLKSGVHITFIGSIDDQLVSLESSIFASVSHPHIYRAVSIDARVHAPNFLSHLVGFALKLRNLGIQDHGLIRELSSPLAGSLYTGEGHSRLYESENCYDLAVDWSLLTSSMNDASLLRQTNPSGPGNPFILPFAMRGILEEEFVKNELKGETSELLQQFDDWKPTTKVLKDVKFRLEGIRSKL